MTTCAECGKELVAGARFCMECGAPQSLACPGCGVSVQPAQKFCMECGTALTAAHAREAAGAAPESENRPQPERRLVSVLFADLVGFTALSEHRDPEEVRELLSAYFDRCRTVIERYGGMVEKFIGDAVMAVWGTPVAREDDAERAVRAGLALTHAIGDLGAELRVRVGILTGNAAVDLAAKGEGMVLGDTVNTASRLQSIAQPGTVLVDDVTRRASEAAVAYEDAGEHEVKGREQPVHAWTALRVVAGAGGARRGAGVEAPFVGRDHELQVIIDAGDESAHEHIARRVAIVGEAGSGKSRVLWEFFKHLDGIEEGRWWHQGRCLSYGEGVAYWALAEMVRTRAGIAEEESPASAREKLRAAVEQHVPDERERRLVEPRLAHLLRLEERADADRADLFSGWRLFFERMAASKPVILVFEDLQWADSGLLDFIDYLLEWSAALPIFILALGRPELRARRPAWDVLILRPLEPAAIRALLDALAPGLPEELVAEIGQRSEGIPLYAVETIRMLQDRGVLVAEGAQYVLTGDVSELEVPETLQALVASRLDGLSAGERSLLQDASVLGHSFTAAGVAALVRTVAYGTLSRRIRKARHLAAARYLERTWPGEAADIAEVLASHYLEAIRADPDAEDVGTLRASARERLTAAGRAAASLALGPEAQRYFEQAAELAEHELERAGLFEQAGRALRASGDSEAAEHELRRAIELSKRAGIPWGGAAALLLANMLRIDGQLDEALALLRPFAAGEDPDMDAVVRAEALAEIAASHIFGGEFDKAGPLLDEALTTLEEQQAWPALANVLISRAVYLILTHRLREAAAVLRLGVSLANDHGLAVVAIRGRYNLASIALENDQFADAVREVDDALTLARERGDRSWERMLEAQAVAPLAVLGRWDETARAARSLLEGGNDINAVEAASYLVQIAAAHGDQETVELCCAVARSQLNATHVDQAACGAVTLARAALERDDAHEALLLAQPVLDASGLAMETLEEAFACCVDAAVAAADEVVIADLDAFVAGLPPARATPLLRAGRARLLAELAHRRGDAQAAIRLEDDAIELLRSVGARPLLAKALQGRASRRHDAEAAEEARSILQELGATRWLDRIARDREVAV